MGIADAKPHPEYPMLVRQFNALKTVCVGLERMLGDKGKDWRIDETARKTLDSEREANAILTARAEALEAALTSIRDLLPIEQDNYSRHVFAIAANALEPETR